MTEIATYEELEEEFGFGKKKHFLATIFRKDRIMVKTFTGISSKKIMPSNY